MVSLFSLNLLSLAQVHAALEHCKHGSTEDARQPTDAVACCKQFLLGLESRKVLQFVRVLQVSESCCWALLGVRQCVSAFSGGDFWRCSGHLWASVVRRSLVARFSLSFVYSSSEIAWPRNRLLCCGNVASLVRMRSAKSKRPHKVCPLPEQLLETAAQRHVVPYLHGILERNFELKNGFSLSSNNLDFVHVCLSPLIVILPHANVRSTQPRR
jgi:hypothetical protein